MYQNPTEIEKLFTGLGNIGANLFYVGSNLGHFGAALENGPGALSLFNEAVSNLTTAVLDYATKAFKEAAQMETERIGVGGAIAAGFDQKVTFQQGLKLYDDSRVQIAGIAAAFPGVTSEYTKALTLIADDLGAALNSPNKSGEQLAKEFSQWGPEIVKNLVLNSKLYGQDIPISAVTRSFSKLLNTGTITSKEIFIQRNPLLLASIQKYEKENKKLSQLTKFERLNALNTIFAKTFSTEQLAMLTKSFSAKVETAKSFLLDPDVGLLGFNRKFKDSNGEQTTFFKVLADAAAPFVEALSESAILLTKFADPLKGATKLIQDKVAPKINEVAASLSRGVFVATQVEGSFQEKLIAGLNSTLGIDIETYDFAAAITRFFDNIAATIDAFGKPGNKIGASMLDKSIDAFINGIVKIVGSLFNKISERAIADPVGSLKLAFVLNPSATIQFLTLLLSVIPLAVSILQLFAQIVPLVSTIFQALVAAIATPIGIGLLIVGILAAVAYFSDNIKLAADFFVNIPGYFQPTFLWLSTTLQSLGKAGQSLKDAFSAMMRGDWSGMGTMLWDATANIAAALGALAMTIVVGALQLLAGIFSGIGDGIGNLSNWLIQNASGPFKEATKWLGVSLQALGIGFGALSGLLDGLVKLDFGKVAFNGAMLIGAVLVALISLLPTLVVAVVELLALAFGGLGDWITSFGNYLIGLGGGSLSTAVTWLGYAIRAVGQAFNYLGEAFSGLASFDLGKVIVNILAAIGGVLAGILTLIPTLVVGLFELLKLAFNGLGNILGDAAVSLMSQGGPFGNTLAWLGNTAQKMGIALQALAGIFDGILTLDFGKIVYNIFLLIGATFMSAISLLGTIIAASFEGLSSIGSNILVPLFKAVEGFFNDLGSNLINFGGSLSTKLVGGAVNTFGTAFGGLADIIKGIFTLDPQLIATGSINLIGGLAAALATLFAALALGAFELLANLLAKPAEIATNFGQWLINLGGVFTNFGVAVAIFGDVFKSLSGIAKGIANLDMGLIATGIIELIGSILTGLSVLAYALVSGLFALIGGLLQPLGSVIGNAFGSIASALINAGNSIFASATGMFRGSIKFLAASIEALGQSLSQLLQGFALLFQGKIIEALKLFARALESLAKSAGSILLGALTFIGETILGIGAKLGIQFPDITQLFTKYIITPLTSALESLIRMIPGMSNYTITTGDSSGSGGVSSGGASVSGTTSGGFNFGGLKIPGLNFGNGASGSGASGSGASVGGSGTLIDNIVKSFSTFTNTTKGQSSPAVPVPAVPALPTIPAPGAPQSFNKILQGLSQGSAQSPVSPVSPLPVIASSSESIVPKPTSRDKTIADLVSALSSGTSGAKNSELKNVNVSINNYAGDDIPEKLRIALEQLLSQ